QVLNGYRVVGEVGALGLVLDVCVVDAHAAGRQAGYVRMHRRRVEGDEELGWPAGDVALPADADVVPGRLALDVRREDVLPVHGDPHLEERSQEGQVRCLAARAVGGRYCNREVVHHRPVSRPTLGLIKVSGTPMPMRTPPAGGASAP